VQEFVAGLAARSAGEAPINPAPWPQGGVAGTPAFLVWCAGAER
jgi:hypothetical protein